MLMELSDLSVEKKLVSIDFKDIRISITASRRRSSSSYSSKLFLHLNNEAWEHAVKHVSKKQKHLKDENTSAHLHFALSKKAPLFVIQALHEAFPTAITQCDQEHGRLPLHTACENGLPLDVVKYLHEQSPGAVEETCNGGMLPLHLAVVSNACRLPVICYLLASYPGGMTLKDKNDMTALDYVEHSSHPCSDIVIREFERGVCFWGAKDLYDPSGSAISLFIIQKQWDKALERILKYPDEVKLWTVHEGIRMLPIHYACKHQAPPHIISELTEIHPYGLCLTCGEYNMTALHLACEYGCSLEVILNLLREFGDAASYKDDLGLLPLHLACSRGASFKVIEALVKVNPKAVSAVDRKGHTPSVYIEAAPYPHSKSILELLSTTDVRPLISCKPAWAERIFVPDPKMVRFSDHNQS